MLLALGSTQVAARTTMPAQFDLESQLEHLVRQISAEMTGSQKTSVAVIEFSDLDGKVTRLGKLFSEELITRSVQLRPGERADDQR
jgi:hypothetical protein